MTSSSTTPPRLRIAICGGGVGGLSLAVVLGKYAPLDVQVDLYEATVEFTQIGAGVTIFKRTWHILKELGLDSSMEKMTVKPPVDEPTPSFVLRKSDQPEQGFNFHQMILPCGSISMHRADMLKVLCDNLPSKERFRSHFSKRLTSYQTEKSGEITLHFEDGSRASADLLVGANGIKSRTRMKMYEDLALIRENGGNAMGIESLRGFINSTYSGTSVYRAIYNTEVLLSEFPEHQAAKLPMIYCGLNKSIVTYPVSRGKLVNIAVSIADTEDEGKPLRGPMVKDATTEELMNHFMDWEPEVRSLLKCADKPTKWIVAHIRGLPYYISGQVALLGDSAHAMAPYLGSGAGQAIEDAYILGHLLSHPAVKTSYLPAVLKCYESVRKPRASSFVEGSRTAGYLYKFTDVPSGIDVEKLREGSGEELQKLTAEICKRWEVLWDPLPDGDWRKAEAMLEDVLRAGPIRMSCRIF